MRVAEVVPGAYHLRAFLSADDQAGLLATVRAVAAGPAGFYRPRVRGGGYMHCEMLCLGRHWNPRTYRYEATRADFDGQPAPPLPAALVDLAARAAAIVGFAVRPDICLINRYAAGGRMGLHQDKDEAPATLDAGVPIVSLSLGDSARFVLGGWRRREATTPIALVSGDAFVMGGPSRLRYHGVSRIVSGTGPPALGLDGRINLTFRRYDV